MTAPNIRTITTMTGKTAVQEVSNVATAIVTNSVSSNQVYKLNALYISNINGDFAQEVSAEIYRDSNAYYIARTVVVPADATLDLFSKSLYLEEGDELRISANTGSNVHAVCSYEVIA
jgi:hypothetical protein